MTASLVAVFAWSFVAATILPLSSEIPLAYLVNTRRELALPVLAATAGNYLGACTTYWLARGVVLVWSRRREAKPEPGPGQRRTVAWVRRWGAPALALSWVPVLGDSLVVAAGTLRVPFAACSVWLIAGKLLRYLVVAWVALRAGAVGSPGV